MPARVSRNTVRIGLLAVVGAALTLTAQARSADAACQVLDPQEGWQPLDGCQRDTHGAPVIDASTRARLPYDDLGNAAVLAGTAFYYVKADGRRLQVILWDNGPDPFEEGLVRSPRGDGMIYMNNDFQQAVPGTYTFAWPFRDGQAEVCNGCVRGQAHGEHVPMTGGQWLHIDRHGRQTSPVRDATHPRPH